jgi:hypothetical protein
VQTIRRFTIAVLLLSGTASALAAQQPVAEPDEPDGKPVPANRSPEAGVKNASQQLPAFPASYWASKMKPGEVAIIDGVISVREGAAEDGRILIPGVPMNEQPKFDLSPIDGDTSAATRQKVLAQTRQFADWAASYYGRHLPPKEQQELQSLYRSMADSGSLLAGRAAKSADAVRQAQLAVAGLVSRSIVREREIFAPHAEAVLDRYTGITKRAPQKGDTAGLRAAIYAWMQHDAREVRRPAVPSQQGKTFYHQRGYLPDLPRMQAVTPQKAQLPAYFWYCLSRDTIVETKLVETIPYNWAEARIYVAIHPVVEELRDLLDSYGVDEDWLYHSSIGGAVWQSVAERKITSTYSVGKCPIPVFDTTRITIKVPKVLIKADSFTEYKLRSDHWSYANGASGTYPSDDELILVKRKVFDTGDAYTKAIRWLHTPTPGSNGKYHRIRAVSYSVGDYLFNWICQVDVNAFAVRRYSFAPIGSPAAEIIYGLYGNRGISARSWWGKIIKGCVPGKKCFWNYPPIASGVFEQKLAGRGYNLDKFWSPNLNSWYNSDATYNSHTPHWPQPAEDTYVVAGWPEEVTTATAPDGL